MVYNIGENNSLVTQYISEIRSVKIQNDRLRFRRNLERLGEIIAYEISKTLPYRKEVVTTPLGTIDVPVLEEQPVIGTILRAGIPMHHGILNYFDHADNAFISAYRKHTEGGSFVIELEYLACADLQDRILIVADPMLATGASMVKTLKQVFEIGKPRHTHIACVIASRAGIKMVQEHLTDYTIWTAAIDEELNPQSYIVPGLGDAGDLAFGEKMQH
jgi:uracil phosphoribosyltransferase